MAGETTAQRGARRRAEKAASRARSRRILSGRRSSGGGASYTLTDISPEIISYVGGKPSVVEQRRTTSGRSSSTAKGALQSLQQVQAEKAAAQRIAPAKPATPESGKIQPAQSLTREQIQQKFFGADPNVVYRNGYGYSVAPEKQAEFLGGKREVYQTDNTSPTGGVAQTGAVWEVQPAPSQKNIFEKTIDDKGYVKGTISYFGDFISALAFRGQERAVKKFGGKFDPQFAELQGSAVKIAPYFTPIAPYVLAASGTEELGTKGGRERIKTTEEYFEQRGISPAASKAIAYGVPALELGIGALGIKADIAKFRLSRDLSRAQTEFVAREKVLTPEKSRIDVVAQTKIGKETTTGVSKTDLFKFGDDYAVGASTGIQATPQRPSISFPTGKVTPKYDVSGIRSTSFSRAVGQAKKLLPTIKPGELVVYPTSTSQSQGVLGKTFGKIFRVGQSPTKFQQELIGGFSKIPDTEVYAFKGGVPKSMRIYPDKISYTGKIDTRGFLMKDISGVKAADVFGVSSGSQKSLISQKFIQQAVSSEVAGLTGAAKAAKAVAISRVTQVPKMSFSVPLIAEKTSQKLSAPLIQTPQPKTKQKSIVSSLSSGVTQTKTLQIISPVEITRQIPVTTTRTSSSTKQTTRTIPVQIPKEITTPAPSRSIVTPGLSPSLTPTMLLPLLFPKTKSALVEKKPKQKGVSYMPQVKSKGKWVNVSKKTMDRNSALSRASKGADNSTARSIRASRRNKAPQVTGITGWGIRQQKFRPSKRSKNVYVEKSTFAIDTRGEKSGLSIAKYSKQQGWLMPTAPKKRKGKKKRRAKSQWLV